MQKAEGNSWIEELRDAVLLPRELAFIPLRRRGRSLWLQGWVLDTGTHAVEEKPTGFDSTPKERI